MVVRDVTARRRAEAERERLLARAALLAEASELFDRSLDEELTLRRVAQLCVRDIADTCVILLGDAPDRVRGVVAAARDEARERELLAALEREPRVGEPIAEVMRGGPGHGGGHAGRARHGALGDRPAAGARPRPRRARRRLRRPRRRRATTRRSPCSRTSPAAPRSRSTTRGCTRSATRSRARSSARCCPGALPDVPGVELAGRYVAAGEGNEVGGDFYDCFATGGGDWALVIGDVCGKGAEAATLTALARYTLRAAAQHTRRPQAVLLELNEALLRQQLGYRFCTVLYASLTPRDGRVDVCLATGGHPLPLVLRAGGAVETAGVAGLAARHPRRRRTSAEQTVELGPGDTLVLVTDGVTEATAADRATGPGRLAALLAGYAGADAAAIAEAVERDALEAQGGAARDDVAVLVARVRGDGARRLPPDGGGSDSDVKLLVVTPEPVDANLLRATLGDEVEGAEVLVVSPATNESPLAFWVSDSDEAIHEAEVAQEETVERLEEEGIDAAGDTGESEPAVAIQDALATFEADRIVVFSHSGEKDYREEAGLEDAEERFGVPVSTRRSLGSRGRSPRRRRAARTARSPSTACAGAGSPCGRRAARAPR